MPSTLAVKAAGASLAGAAAVWAHGHTYGINVAGVWYDGYDPTDFPYRPDPPTVVGWTALDENTGFVPPSSYASGDIICHVDATPAGGHAAVQAGDDIQVYWTPWPATHKGPVIDMLANCHGDCAAVRKTDLAFFTIAAAGLVDDGAPAPGHWATDTLIANNNSWTVRIPPGLAPGHYVWRHEIIALHSAARAGRGAQNYPQCFNLAVAAGAPAGALAPAGTPGERLYAPRDPGLALDIYARLPRYAVPGPPRIAAGTNLPQAALPITARAAAATRSSAPDAAAVREGTGARSEAAATGTAAGARSTDQACRQRPHARGFEA